MPEHKFIWFGDIDVAMLPKKIRYQIDNRPSNLIFPGFTKKEDIKEAYNEADLFLFLTKEETEGIVLLEALSMKTPTIIRDIPIFNWLEDRREIYKGKDLHMFEVLIKYILSKDTSKVQELGREAVLDKDINKVGENLYNIYKSVNNISSTKERSLLIFNSNKIKKYGSI